MAGEALPYGERNASHALMMIRITRLLEKRLQQAPQFAMASGLTTLRQVLRNIHGAGSAFRLPFPYLQ